MDRVAFITGITGQDGSYLAELLLEKNFTLEYCNIVTYENGFSYIDAIFKNKSDIFIYLSKRDIIETGYQTMVYFEPTKLEETKFFIKNLLKLK